ncbi:MAG: leucine-rich repeat domain-containing protein [Bacteroidales bacterium]|jgi:hypothetical protein|nr:leucine-rich repeat domain-containing protein [Bacteroidales bacterium]
MKRIFTLRHVRRLSIALFVIQILFTQTIVAAIAGSGTSADPWLIGTPNAADVKAYLYGGNELVITGVGASYDFSSSSSSTSTKAPWSGNTAITKVSIDDGVTAIGSYSFYNLTKLTAVTISSSVHTLGKGAFSGATSLQNINIPNTVTSIGSYAFNNCSKLTSVQLPASLTKIEESTFDGCSVLASITIPAAVSTIEKSAFYDSGLSGALVISDNVIIIDDNAFYGTKITSLTLGAHVQIIGKSAFEPKSSSTATLAGALVIPNSVISIGDNAFKYTKITSLTLGENVQTIGSSAFEGYSASAATLGGALVIPGSVTSIGKSAFKYAKITSLTLSENLTTIGESAFEGASELASTLVIPTSVQNIGKRAFYGAKKLTGDVLIPVGITKIEESTFEGCEKLTSISLPEGITEIGSSAFSGNKGLTGELKLPSTLVSIGNYAFQNCSGLSGTLRIPNSVTTIGGNAFDGDSGFTSLILGANVSKYNSSYIFQNCTGLTQVVNLSPVPQYLSSNVFKNVPVQNITLIVPLTSYDAYKTASKVPEGQANEWKNFGTVKEIVPLPKVVEDYLVYNGNEQTGIEHNTAHHIHTNGSVAATEVGDYSATFALHNTAAYVWEGSYTSTPLTQTWSIVSSVSLLPVELTTFTAVRSGVSVTIQWSTHSETNNDYFSVERSADGVNFQSIGEVAGAGTTTVAHRYSLIDYAPLTGISYYRLRQSDYNGTLSYSRVLSVFSGANNAALHAWAQNGKILIQGLISGEVYQIYTLSGTLVHQSIAAADIEHISLFTNGIYIVRQGSRSVKLNY